MRTFFALAALAAFASVSHGGSDDVDPSVIVKSCSSDWCRPIVAAYQECILAMRLTCESDRKVKAAHHKALGREIPAELDDNPLATQQRKQKEHAEREEKRMQEAKEREGRLKEKTRFMGYALTMSMSDAETIAGTNCNRLKNHCYKKIGERFIYLSFHDGKLYSVSASTHGDTDFLEITEMLVERYGAPISKKTTEVTNRMGAKFQKLSINWKLNDARISASNIADTIDEGIVVFFDPASVRAVSSENRQSRSNIF